MTKAYSIRVFVPDGDPEGIKIVSLLNWTGIGIAIPRSQWNRARTMPELVNSGVYVLVGPTMDSDDDLSTVYIGHTDQISTRITQHSVGKEFWDWAYVFVSSNNELNRAHVAWLEYRLYDLAKKAGRCNLENTQSPSQPRLTRPEEADIDAFLEQILRILPLVSVRVFEKPISVMVDDDDHSATASNVPSMDVRDTIIVPAQEEGFQSVFLGQNRWFAVRIGGGMLGKIQYIAAYRTAPVSAVTHVAKVARIESYGDAGKYQLIFDGPAVELDTPIPFGEAPRGSMQASRYAKYSQLKTARDIKELLS